MSSKVILLYRLAIRPHRCMAIMARHNIDEICTTFDIPLCRHDSGHTHYLQAHNRQHQQSGYESTYRACFLSLIAVGVFGQRPTSCGSLPVNFLDLWKLGQATWKRIASPRARWTRHKQKPGRPLRKSQAQHPLEAPVPLGLGVVPGQPVQLPMGRLFPLHINGCHRRSLFPIPRGNRG